MTLSLDPAQIAALRDLLDLLADFPDNDQRARYLLACDWGRANVRAALCTLDAPAPAPDFRACRECGGAGGRDVYGDQGACERCGRRGNGFAADVTPAAPRPDPLVRVPRSVPCPDGIPGCAVLHLAPGETIEPTPAGLRVIVAASDDFSPGVSGWAFSEPNLAAPECTVPGCLMSQAIDPEHGQPVGLCFRHLCERYAAYPETPAWVAAGLAAVAPAPELAHGYGERPGTSWAPGYCWCGAWALERGHDHPGRPCAGLTAILGRPPRSHEDAVRMAFLRGVGPEL